MDTRARLTILVLRPLDYRESRRWVVNLKMKGAVGELNQSRGGSMCPDYSNISATGLTALPKPLNNPPLTFS